MASNPARVAVRKAAFGKGLFATKRFRDGQRIGEVTGRIIADPDYGSDYCIEMGPGGSMEPGTPWRYLNHACEPNCSLFSIHEDDNCPPEERTIILEALRNVQPGAELTIDYEWSADNAIPCGCGGPNCREWVVAADELHLVKQGRHR
mgnify:CR=1 FL=1